MMVTGPSGSGKTEWTRKLLLTSLIQPPPERILWCYGQWQPLYEDLQKRIPWIEFVHGIPDYLNSPQFINPGKRNLIIFDDLMTEAKCDQRIADIFTKGSHHRNISIWSRGQISNFKFCCTPQEEKVGYYFQSGTCLGASETHVLLSFLWSIICKWPVITVTP